MKHLVVCCDGTWNSVRVSPSGASPPTNVVKLALGVAPEDVAGNPQLVHYQPGVGTRRHERLWGGLFGFGLARNLKACYRFVVDEYEPGDRLYVFGFSRGAFTARSLVGLIRNAGILRRRHRDRLDEAYRLYRAVGARQRPDGAEATMFRRMHAYPDTGGALVHFVGVWDTVGALGIPGAPAWLARGRWAFHDTTLSRRVGNAYHAMAIDERRVLFRPTLWERRDPDPEQGFQQVWFAGVHKDVGGGYAQPGLAEIPLLWIAERARSCDLCFLPGHFGRVPGAADDDPRRATGERTDANPFGPAHDSWTGLHRLVPPVARRLADDGGRGRLFLASSALERTRTGAYDLPTEASSLPIAEAPSAPRVEVVRRSSG